MKFNRLLLAIVFAMTGLVSTTFAQGFRVEGKTDSVVGAGPFVSPEGRFSIELSSGIKSFRPLAVETPIGKMRGDAYEWAMKEGSFTVGYVDAPQPVDDAETTPQGCSPVFVTD